MSSTTNKVIIITGSSSGIGEAAAYLFTENGYHVVVTGSSAEKVARVHAAIKQKYPDGPEPLSVVADLTDPENVATILTQTIDKFGRLDVLVNNAGRAGFTTCNDPNSYEVYRQLMALNLDSTVKLSLLAVPYLKQSKGNIINIASVAAVKPAEMSYAYCACKAAMVAFGKSLACDLAPDVRVNNILPGPIVTDIADKVGAGKDILRAAGNLMCLTKRAGEPEEVADLIYYLASDKAKFITAADMVIDGGYIIKPTEFTSLMAKAKEQASKAQ